MRKLSVTTQRADRSQPNNGTGLAQARPCTPAVRRGGLLGILGHIGSDEEAASVAKALLGDLAPGSYLVIADGVNTDRAGNEAQDRYNQQSPVPYHLRSPAQLAAFFDGLQLVEPGVVPCSQWRPDPEAGIEPPQMAVYCGVAVKP